MSLIAKFKLWWKPLDMSLDADYRYTPTNAQRRLDYENRRAYAESVAAVGVKGEQV